MINYVEMVTLCIQKDSLCGSKEGIEGTVTFQNMVKFVANGEPPIGISWETF